MTQQPSFRTDSENFEDDVKVLRALVESGSDYQRMIFRPRVLELRRLSAGKVIPKIVGSKEGPFTVVHMIIGHKTADYLAAEAESRDYVEQNFDECVRKGEVVLSEPLVDPVRVIDHDSSRRVEVEGPWVLSQFVGSPSGIPLAQSEVEVPVLGSNS